MKINHKLILTLWLATALICVASVSPVKAQSVLDDKLDSLFVLASSASVLHADLVEPAKDSIAACGADAVPFLIGKFTTKSARERWAVIFILRKIGSPAVPDLVDALKLNDSLIVQRVCWALGDIKDSTATLPLIDVCGHNQWQVRDQAIGALGKIGDSRGGPSVVNALQDSIGQVRKSASVSVGRLEVAEAIPQLVHLLGDEFYGARLTAFEGLKKFDSSLVIPVLADSLSSANSRVGNLACDLLGEIGGDRVIDLLYGQLGSVIPGRHEHASVALANADPYDNCGRRHYYLNDNTPHLLKLKLLSVIAASQDE